MMQVHFFKNYILIGVLFILTGVVLGAFAAHSLKELLSENALLSFETGVKYQFYSGFGMLLMIILKLHFTFKSKAELLILVIGTLFFSGSIYLLAFDEFWNMGLKAFLWPITPLGGLLIIISWSIFFFRVFKVK